ncbi:MAG: MgtC/SapB family protein [Candidatus Omnitrophota bacterium]
MMLTDQQIIVRLIVSVILSGLIGFERELHKRTAGLRTHMLVCVGSTLIMLTSLYVFDIYNATVPLDPTRIAAGVVTGIGFLGAGAILRSREGAVQGLTTAASIWVVSGLGLAIGCGFYTASFTTCVLVLFILHILRYLEPK